MSRNFTLLLIAALFIGLVTVSFSAELASRDPQPRNVVLEEYTGIYCTYCPDGHKRARALKEANPGRVVLINVHAGGYAVPKAGAPDFRTPFGEQLVGLAQVAGFPAGSINRMVFPGAANQSPYTPQTQGGTALSRGGWAIAAADSVLNGSISPMNIGAVTKWSNSTRELNVDLELFFTSGIEGAVKLNVALIESHIWGPQTGGEDPVNYEHNFMLRHMLTGQWGEQITTTDKKD
ncbi:MAG TPA: Omp28-related outer membrane protein [Candidatus Kapabacteria bacterium]|nr:Omp28-related outer membrane protein [Candidatus Kapabacteria bacterium]